MPAENAAGSRSTFHQVGAQVGIGAPAQRIPDQRPANIAYSTTSVQSRTILGMAISPQAARAGRPRCGDVDQHVAEDVEQRAENTIERTMAKSCRADGLDDEGAQARDAEEALEHQAAEEDIGQVGPALVMMGMSAFFSTWRNSTTASDRPLARAVRT